MFYASIYDKLNKNNSTEKNITILTDIVKSCDVKFDASSKFLSAIKSSIGNSQENNIRIYREIYSIDPKLAMAYIRQFLLAEKNINDLPKLMESTDLLQDIFTSGLLVTDSWALSRMNRNVAFAQH